MSAQVEATLNVRVKSEQHNTPLMLIGDIGATNTRLALSRREGAAGEYHRICQASYLTAEIESDAQLIERFLSVVPAELRALIDVACFGVAGPVVEGRADLTNAGWSLSESVISAAIDAPALLVNDFYAQAMAMPTLTRDELAHVCGPERILPTWGRSIAVLGAGSGLGEAILVPAAARPRPHQHTTHKERASEEQSADWVVVATEGGHARFAPRNEVEVGLNRWLQERYGSHVSVERVVSGTGVVNTFLYLLEDRPLPAIYTEPLTGAQVSRGATQHKDPIAIRALEHFVDVYADEAANLTLKSNAGVVFLSGGITPKQLPLIQARFPSVFVDKGRYRDLLSQTGVWVVTADDPGLRGARATAERLFQDLEISY